MVADEFLRDRAVPVGDCSGWSKAGNNRLRLTCRQQGCSWGAVYRGERLQGFVALNAVTVAMTSAPRNTKVETVPATDVSSVDWDKVRLLTRVALAARYPGPLGAPPYVGELAGAKALPTTPAISSPAAALRSSDE